MNILQIQPNAGSRLSLKYRQRGRFSESPNFQNIFLILCALLCVFVFAHMGGSRGRVQGVRTPHPPEMTCGFLIQLVFCKKNYVVYCRCWQETSAPPPKKKSSIRPWLISLTNALIKSSSAFSNRDAISCCKLNFFATLSFASICYATCGLII